MAYTITSLTDLEIIEVTVEGKLDQELRKEILLTSAIELKKANYKRLLIDLVHTEFDTETPITGALTLVNYMRTLGFPPGTKMAFYTRIRKHTVNFLRVQPRQKDTSCDIFVVAPKPLNGFLKIDIATTLQLTIG